VLTQLAAPQLRSIVAEASALLATLRPHQHNTTTATAAVFVTLASKPYAPDDPDSIAQTIATHYTPLIIALAQLLAATIS